MSRAAHRRASRALLVQALLLGALALGAAWIARNVSVNLAASNLTLSFSFLHETAGFAVSQTLIAYSEQSTYARALAVGLLNTLLVAAIGIVAATVLGFAIGIARLSRNWLLSQIAAAYVETVRNVPLLLQLFVWYFAVLAPLPPPREALSLGGMAFLHSRGLHMPAVSLSESGSVLMACAMGLAAAWYLGSLLRRHQALSGRRFPVLPLQALCALGLPLAVFIAAGARVTLSVPVLERFDFAGGVVLHPELLALVMALTVYTASYIAETVRGGILAVPRGQVEAAQALGLTRGQALRFVIVPLALRAIVPPLTSQYLNLTKNSSLAIAIGYPDLVSVFAGTALNQSGHAIEIIAITMGVYLALSLATAFVMNRYNARVALKGA